MKCDELIEKIKQADEDNKRRHIPINIDIQIEDLLDAFAELKAENAELKFKLKKINDNFAIKAKLVYERHERHTLRALWLARAERAKEKQQLFHFSLGYEKLCIDGFYDPYSGRRELSPKQWIKAFNKVEVKLLKKAGEYK